MQLQSEPGVHGVDFLSQMDFKLEEVRVIQGQVNSSGYTLFT